MKSVSCFPYGAPPTRSTSRASTTSFVFEYENLVPGAKRSGLAAANPTICFGVQAKPSLPCR
jgi:hypothetical protein